MSPDLWRNVKIIFDESLKLPQNKRREFIKEQCGKDVNLFSEVESLLNSFEAAGDFLDENNPVIIPDNESEFDNLVNTRIGAYRIVKLIAHGGMGSVYLGERYDAQFEKLVAIKLINPGINNNYIIKRFKNERQTLANLEHPNIARLIDGGTTDTGLPYFIMEYIEGEPVDVYCDKNKLTINQRLELFRTICDAVYYAHQHLIIHRDIKPGNILVTGDGIPKLLDFGIAKLLESGNEDYEYSNLTRTGMWHFTPEYASPEQISGGKITTSSDVYSLGILLYKLLTGHNPYRIKTNMPSEINQIITEVHPEKPSSIITKTEEIISSENITKTITPETISAARNENVDKLRKKLSGDLDNIILMALRKEPQRRYSSVQQFSDDIHRHLKELPVIAGKDTFTYKSSKFIRRHKIGFTATMLLVLLTVAGISAVLWQAKIASAERDKAQLEAKKSVEVKQFIQNMFSAVDPKESGGKDVKVYDVLQEASKTIDNELKDQPEVQAEINTTIGVTYQNLGLYNEGEIHLKKALELKENLYTKNSLEYASALKDLALLIHHKAELSLADSLYRESIAVHRKVNRKPEKLFADALNDYGILLCDRGLFDESEAALREALNITLNLSEKNEDLSGTITNNLAITVDYQGKIDEAEKLYRKAYKFFSGKYGSIHPNTATATNNLAFTLINKKNYPEAEKLFAEAYEIKLKLYGPDHPDVGLALHNWGAALFYINKYDMAVNKLNKALKNYNISLEKNHFWYARSFHWLGKVYLAKNDLKKSEDNLRKALMLRKKAHESPNHFEIANTESELAYCLTLQGSYIEAEKMLVKSYKILNETLGNENTYTNSSKQYLIKLYNLLGKNEEAEKLTAGLLPE